jgi:hypothetical protein
LQETSSVQYSYNYLTELKGRLQSVHEVARQKLILEKSKAYYDKDAAEREVQVERKVSFFDETVRRGRSKKLSPQYIGPYKVLAVNGVNVTIKKDRTAQKVHVNRVRPFY